MSGLSAGFRSGAGQPSREHQLQINPVKARMETIGTDHPQVNRSRMRSAELSMYNLLKKNSLESKRRKGRRGIGGRKQGVLIRLHGLLRNRDQDWAPKFIARTRLARCSRRPASCANSISAPANSTESSGLTSNAFSRCVSSSRNTGKSLATIVFSVFELGLKVRSMSRCLRLLSAGQLF
jgi:hypothetical protein